LEVHVTDWTQDLGAGIRVRGLRRTFDGRRVLNGVDLDIAPGEFVALLGASGSGKTTILRALAGLDTPDSGTIQAPRRRAVVFQEHRLMPWKRVRANVALGLDRDATAARVDQTLAEVGLSDHADAWPKTLSGGESQRAALARALVRRPELLLLDEPFGALDALTRMKMHDLVLRLWENHRPAVLLVTHDVDEALQLADRALVLVGGRIEGDYAIDAMRPRQRTDRDLEVTRESLLARLGVLPPATDPGRLISLSLHERSV
jgi:sulfonate transport system ATP-binding protein